MVNVKDRLFALKAHVNVALQRKGIFKNHGTVRAAMKESRFLHKVRRPHGITNPSEQNQYSYELQKSMLSECSYFSGYFVTQTHDYLLFKPGYVRL